MKIDACVRGILGEDADSLTDEELSGLIADLRQRQKTRQAADASVDDATALRLEAEAVAADLELAGKIEKRNAALNIMRHKEAKAFVDSFGDAARGIEALLAGTNKRIEGGRLSVDSRARAREGRYLGGLVNELKREGLLDFVKARLFAMLIVGLLIAFTIMIVVSPYRRDRVFGFMDPWADAFGRGYQLSHALIAFGRGELFGVGAQQAGYTHTDGYEIDPKIAAVAQLNGFDVRVADVCAVEVAS